MIDSTCFHLTKDSIEWSLSSAPRYPKVIALPTAWNEWREIVGDEALDIKTIGELDKWMSDDVITEEFIVVPVLRGGMMSITITNEECMTERRKINKKGAERRKRQEMLREQKKEYGKKYSMRMIWRDTLCEGASYARKKVGV